MQNPSAGFCGSDRFPEELWHLIFRHLSDRRTRWNLYITCKKFRRVVEPALYGEYGQDDQGAWLPFARNTRLRDYVKFLVLSARSWGQTHGEDERGTLPKKVMKMLELCQQSTDKAALSTAFRETLSTREEEAGFLMALFPQVEEIAVEWALTWQKLLTPFQRLSPWQDYYSRLKVLTLHFVYPIRPVHDVRSMDCFLALPALEELRCSGQLFLDMDHWEAARDVSSTVKVLKFENMYMTAAALCHLCGRTQATLTELSQNMYSDSYPGRRQYWGLTSIFQALRLAAPTLERLDLPLTSSGGRAVPGVPSGMEALVNVRYLRCEQQILIDRAEDWIQGVYAPRSAWEEGSFIPHGLHVDNLQTARPEAGMIPAVPESIHFPVDLLPRALECLELTTGSLWKSGSPLKNPLSLKLQTYVRSLITAKVEGALPQLRRITFEHLTVDWWHPDYANEPRCSACVENHQICKPRYGYRKSWRVPEPGVNSGCSYCAWDFRRCDIWDGRAPRSYDAKDDLPEPLPLPWGLRTDTEGWYTRGARKELRALSKEAAAVGIHLAPSPKTSDGYEWNLRWFDKDDDPFEVRDED